MANLPTGKVLLWMWQSGGDAYVWDPTGPSFTGPFEAGSNIFCSGHAGLEDGEVLYNEFGQTVNVVDWRES